MNDKEKIIHIANLAGLEEWQLDREIVQLIKNLSLKYKYADTVACELKKILCPHNH